MAAEWLVYHYDHYGINLGDFRPMNTRVEIRNSDEGGVDYELALSDPSIPPMINQTAAFAPFRTDYQMWRVSTTGGGTNLVSSGMHSSRNLNNGRDTILIGGKDWFHYLKRRIYPFDYYAYVNNRDWVSWPKKWGVGGDVELRTVIVDIIEAMKDADPFPNTPNFNVGVLPTGVLGHYKIYPADRSTIFDHINTLSEMEPGFEWDIDPYDLTIRLYSPDRAQDSNPIYTFLVSSNAATGSIIDLDWTDEGPAATWVLGLGTGSSIKKGGVDSYGYYNDPNDPVIRTYRRLDAVVDFGPTITQQELNKLTTAEGFRSRHPDRTCNLRITNPELLSPNFWTGGRPRGLLGRRIKVKRDFGYYFINTDYKINAIIIDVDNSGNEEVEFELEQIRE